MVRVVQDPLGIGDPVHEVLGCGLRPHEDAGHERDAKAGQQQDKGWNEHDRGSVVPIPDGLALLLLPFLLGNGIGVLDWWSPAGEDSAGRPQDRSSGDHGAKDKQRSDPVQMKQLGLLLDQCLAGEGPEGGEPHERKPGHVTYEGWEAIDSHERGAGEPHGRPRVKLTTFDELLEAARIERVSG